MLPTQLLVARVSRGRVKPAYAQMSGELLNLAERMINVFEGCVGGRKALLADRLRRFEEEDFDYRLIRGLSTLLERRCLFEAESKLDPRVARSVVFEEASRRRVASVDERRMVIEECSVKLGVAPEELERSLWADLDEELILRRFDGLEPSKLIRWYNLSLAQTLLFKSLRMEFTVSEGWKEVFRALKRLGLMYSIEGDKRVAVDGPLSLLKMTERYGTALAKLLPYIVRAEDWWLKADVLSRRRNRIYVFEARSGEAELEPIDEVDAQLYDSGVEERFARAFNSLESGWRLRREPEPIQAGSHVLIPDFSFEKRGLKVYLEILGFWTQDYLERKVSKLNQIHGVDLIVAADEELACSKLHKLQGNVIYYQKDVPLRPILDHLRKREEEALKKQVEELRRVELKVDGEAATLDELASKHNTTPQAIRKIIEEAGVKGYRLIGDYVVKEDKLEAIRRELESLGEASLTQAAAIIESYGFKDHQQILAALGYTVEWSGLDYTKTRVRKI